ncbi:hypothetical protein U9M48_030953 [Paspalum notatum var. saurae]|uniref:Uncharacterized protein n=1 Tax=Paspalum notatum var. saurae TaxID=547442 RepID=A0AAQ3U4Q7_PASNO
MSGVVVTKALPVIVRPSSESELGTPPPLPNDTTVALSFFDRCVPPIPVTSLLVFDRAIHDPVQTIKMALSRALAHYRPLAGRLDGAGNIACTDEGVPFVAASAGCALQDATPAALRQAEDLVVRYPGLLCRDAADPLLLVQVTEFACGGFAVGVTSNHVAADGVGMGQFLQAVGELARGVSAPSVAPTRRWDDGGGALPAAPPPKSSTAAERDARRLVRLDVVVPSGLIGRVKAGRFGGERCTALDAVMAVLWRCRTRATTTAGDAPARLNFVCNVRARAGAPAGYYGNCLHMQAVEATAGEVAGSEIGHLVRLIRLAKAKVPGGGDDEDSGVVAGADEQQQQPQPLWYEAFNVTDWRNLGLDAVDFGGGAPARVLWQEERTTVPGCVVCPPRRKGAAGREDDDGVDVSTMFVVPEHGSRLKMRNLR